MPPGTASGTFLSFFAAWLILGASYLVFAGSAAAAEAVAGLAAACGATLLLRVLRREGFPPFHPFLRWIAPAWRLPPAVLWDTGLLAAALVRRLAGRGTAGGLLIEHPFAPGEERGREPARRAVMGFGVCFTPNSYLIDLDGGRRVARIRQLVGRRLSKTDGVFLMLR